MELKQGYKMTEIGEIPIDWTVDILGKQADIIRGASPRPIADSKWFSKKSNIGWIRISDITKSNKYLYSTEQKLSTEGVANSRFVHNGSLIMSICASIGKPVITKVNSCIHDGFVAFENIKMNTEYAYYFLKSYEDEWAKQGQTGSQMNLNTDIIKNVMLPIPPLDEQLAIANILSDSDELIVSLEKLIAKKKAIKYGTMQQLMSGKYRIEGFCGEWEVKLLGDLCEIYDGTHQTPNYTVTGFPFYSVENVTNNEFKNTKFISGIEHKKLTATYKIEKGDILMTRIGSIGVCKYIDWDVNASFYVSLALLKCNKCVNSKYLYYYSFTNEFQNELELNSLQSAIPKKINLEPISLIKVILPPTIEEQIAVSTILSDMDSEIEALVKKLTKYRIIKQSMIQELLTGRIRLVEMTQKVQSKKKEKAQNHNEHFNEAVVLSALVSMFSSEKYPMGRFKRQKLAYLLHRHIEGTARGFLKKAAGPYNPSIKYRDETIALKNKYVKECKTDKAKGLVPSENIEQAMEYFKEWYGEDAITWLEQFHYTKNDELELLATVDMAITDLKTKQQIITVDTVKSIICSNKEWKPKLERATFSDKNIQKAIQWSRELFGDC